MADRYISSFDSGDPKDEMPLRNWSIEIHLLGPHNEELPADIFEKAVYNLHPTFEARQKQSIHHLVPAF